MFVEPNELNMQWFLYVFSVCGSKHLEKHLFLLDCHVCGAQKFKKQWFLLVFGSGHPPTPGPNTFGHPMEPGEIDVLITN